MSTAGRTYNSGVWADERLVTRLKALHAPKNLSCAEIARRLNAEFPGSGFTRCAVIGKIGRLGLSEPQKPAKPRPIRQRANPFGIEGVVGMKARVERELRSPAKLPPATVISIPTEPVGLMQLGPHVCKWPTNNGEDPELGWLFCGAWRPAEDSYCPKHSKLSTWRQGDKAVRAADVLNRKRAAA